MANKAVIPFLVGMMLLTGVCNTLLSKYQDLQCIRNCDSQNPQDIERFSQPVIQTAQMFVGESGCWLVVAGFSLYRRYRLKKDTQGYKRLDTEIPQQGHQDGRVDGIDDQQADDVNPAARPLISNAVAATADAERRLPLVGRRILLLALPACCDITGTTLMNIGLLFVAASIYQMTRGALVLFVGLFSVLFLRRKVYFYQWSALFIVVIGVAIVGLAGAIAPNPQAQPLNPRFLIERGTMVLREAMDEVTVQANISGAVQTVLGVLMIAGAQVFTATQFVLEEWILEQYALEPLKVVGWEGVFGFLITFVGMIILHLIIGRTDAGHLGYFDMVEGWREITQYRIVAITSVLIMISIGGFNFFGLSITRSVSATARSIIDTCRTLFIWIVSLGLGWETFKWLQIVGFVLLVYGTFLFNDIVRPPLQSCVPSGKRKKEELLPEEPIEHM